MNNGFYREFDRERFSDTMKRQADYRSPFQRDRDGIVHSSPFRRLQGKTQVFLTGEYDFYRTRLTHSIEVGQIARSLCHFLRTSGDKLRADFFIDDDLVEAAGLAHDIGNAPFGHAGERFLHKLMAGTGGFEGNAQSLRIITENIYGYTPPKGMAPTRAFLDSILKYKTPYDPISNRDGGKFLYRDQESCLSFVHPEMQRDGADISGLKSIECQIMELADDIAYSIDDIKDGIEARFITPCRIQKWAKDHRQDLTDVDNQQLQELQVAIDNNRHESHLSRRMGALVTGCHLSRRSTFMDDQTERYRYVLERSDSAKRERQTYQSLAQDLVFSTSSLQQLEYKGGLLLTRMFESFVENYESSQPKHLLPDEWHKLLCSSRGVAALQRRTICDFLAGMTDAFAVRTYSRMFEPEYGSLTDLA